MNDFLEKVKDFQKTFSAPVLESPTIPGKDRCELRVNLLQEELDELSEAIKDNDIVEVADACGDLMVVLCGAILEFGLGEKFEEMFNNIHDSNMSKSCNSTKEALETLSFYKKKDGTEGYYKQVGDKWVVYRNGDNKVLKSINYTPADLIGIIE